MTATHASRRQRHSLTHKRPNLKKISLWKLYGSHLPKLRPYQEAALRTLVDHSYPDLFVPYTTLQYRNMSPPGMIQWIPALLSVSTASK